MNKKNMLVSVVTVSYNSVSEIEKTILSVIEQTYPAIELIVIDGGSSDGTVDVLKAYNQSISYWVSEPDRGIYDAMNKGVVKVKGEWVIFMNSGDWFYDKYVIENVFSHEYPSTIGILYGSVEFRFAYEKIVQHPFPLSHLLRGMAFSHQAAFIRTSLLRHSPYNMQYQIVADYEFFLKQYSLGQNFQRISLIIASFDKLTGISASPSYLNYKKHLKELIQIEKVYPVKTKYQLLYPVLCFRFLMKKAVMKIVPQCLWYIFLRKRIKLNQ